MFKPPLRIQLNIEVGERGRSVQRARLVDVRLFRKHRDADTVQSITHKGTCDAADVKAARVLACRGDICHRGEREHGQLLHQLH